MTKDADIAFRETVALWILTDSGGDADGSSGPYWPLGGESRFAVAVDPPNERDAPDLLELENGFLKCGLDALLGFALDRYCNGNLWESTMHGDEDVEVGVFELRTD